MRPGPRALAVAVNGALAVAAVLALGPLLWMVSVSLMAPGEASASPPPLLPSAATLDNYRQLFAEPYVMTQGGPLQSTVSVLYLMYDEGFKWWNLGTASAVAFVLFLIIVAVTKGLLWLAARAGGERLA